MAKRESYQDLIVRLSGEALPCPFCGGRPVVGHADALSFAVQCLACTAAGPAVEVPDVWPKGLSKERDALDKMLVKRAFAKWQKRSLR